MKKITLLIVDDEKSIRNGLKNGILWDQFEIEVIGTAKDGEEALSIIKECQPDIVITDIRMPVCDGLSLIERTVSLGMKISYIIISGFDDFKYAQRAIKYGVDSYLLKPIKKAALSEEIGEICEKIRSLQKENQSKTIVTRKMKIGTIALKQHFLISLVQSQYRTITEIESELLACNIQMKINSPSNILVFTYEQALFKKALGSLKDNLKLFKASVSNIVNEILRENINEIFIDSNDNLVVLLQKPYIGVNEELFLERVCQRVNNIVMEYYNVSMCAGIGNEVSGLVEIHEAYRAALEHLSYRMYDCGQLIFDKNILAIKPPPDSFENTRNNIKLIDSIYLSDRETIMSYTSHFFESLFYIEFPPPNFVRGMCTYLIINVQKGLAVYLKSEDILFEQNDYVYINKICSFTQIKEWIICLFFKYADFFSKCKDMQRDNVIERVKIYIDEHIYEKITAEDVADHIHLSEKYLMNYFKEKTNENFKSYILNLKLDKAKELLKQGNKSISEIAHIIGYTDYRGFNRIFKKHTGQTPSEFQDKFNQ